ncbi:MAG: NBR1-Ig-like domain-containing protein [Anaerolineales bacterium]|jgi:hypothetical protein
MSVIDRRTTFFALLVIFSLVLSGCGSSAEDEESARQTAIAQTVEAALPTEDLSEPNATTTPDMAVGSPTPASLPTHTSSPVSTDAGEDGEEEIGDDLAEFVADVTIPDYSEHLVGSEITKTWRIRNTGTTTWDTDYYLDFQKGERLGASSQINLETSVEPNDFIDLSIDFTVPNASGEFSSYWQLKNGDGQLVGTGEEDKPLTLFMIIMAVDEDGGDDGGNGSSGGISGGAKITKATVSVDDNSVSGTCPADIEFTYTVTTSNAGKVNFYLELTALSPSGYRFDPTPDYDVNFTGGYTVTYTYTLISSSSVSATARVVAVGENTLNSSPINFTISCE